MDTFKKIFPVFALLICITDFSKAQTNTFPSSGNVGIGTTNPTEKLDVHGSVLLTEPGRYYINRYNVTSEQFLATNGQGAGWMVNATFSGTGNPQSNATYSVSAGTYGTSAGYLDFDGNGRNWSFNLSAPSTGIGNPVSFVRVAYFDNSGIVLSPTGNNTDFNLQSDGKIGIGTENPDELLTVDGKIHSKEVIVDLNTDGPDYVFDEDYNLPNLKEIEAYVKTNKHLPEVPSAKEMETNGIQLGEMNMLQLKKIEELTLYVIEQNKAIKNLIDTTQKQQEQIELLKGALSNEN